MAYNTDHLHTAGKITVYTAFVGLLVFAVAFMFNLGEQQIREAQAQSSATTTVTVVNTPPAWTASTTEEFESSSDNPTNVGVVLSWIAIGTDSNAEDYYLLICKTTASPTPVMSGPPECDDPGNQWAVSPETTSGTQANATTTAQDAWAESNAWYAWICDGNPGTPRCSRDYTQGTNATNSSPFEVNHRPNFTVFTDDSPKEAGQTVTFMSTSSDPDSSGVQDTVKLIVCATAGFDTLTDSCTGTLLASTTAFVASDASSTYTISIPTQDQDYGAFGYVIDQHGFEASGGAHGTDATLTVANTAPTVSGAQISLTQPVTTDLVLTVEGGETTGFTLSFVTSDNNSCETAASGQEMVDYNLSIYRSGVGSTTCTPGAGNYDANDCYPSGVATTTWNLDCTPDVGTCSGNSDMEIDWDCTFPLWFIADPTEGDATQSFYNAEDWRAQIQGIDDDAETGALTESDSGVELNNLLAFALNTLTIPYGSLEPGQQTDPLNATTTVSATGNTGVDKNVLGTSMCTTYSGSTPCPNSSTSTIPENEQVFATSTTAYSDATSISSTTPTFVDINVPKSTSTSTPASASAYWGIHIPASVTFAGLYSGENTFTAVLSDPSQWDGS